MIDYTVLVSLHRKRRTQLVFLVDAVEFCVVKILKYMAPRGPVIFINCEETISNSLGAKF